MNTSVKNPHRVLTLGRVTRAWLAGSMAGGSLTPFAIGGLFLVLVPPDHIDLFAALNSALPTIVLTAVLAAIVYAGGIALVGGPAWAALHAIGLRNWPYAVGLGAILTGVVVALLEFLFADVRASLWWLWAGMAFTLPGAVAGYVIWRVAYRPTRATPQAVF